MIRLMSGPTLNSLEDLFILELADLYDAENRLVDALPKMAEAAHEPELRQAFNDHLAQTKEHVKRLEQVFAELDREPQRDRLRR